MIPWIHKNNLEDTMEHLQFTDGQIAMGHLEIEGAIMMPEFIRLMVHQKKLLNDLNMYTVDTFILVLQWITLPI